MAPGPHTPHIHYYLGPTYLGPTKDTSAGIGPLYDAGCAAGYKKGLLAGLKAPDPQASGWSWTAYINWREETIAHVEREGKLPGEA